jgi:hypothetical protein
MHLIDKHLFPKDYDFYVVNDGIDHRTSMLRTGRHRRRSSAAQHLTEVGDRASRRNSTRETPSQAKDELGEEELNQAEGSDAVSTKSKPQEDADMDGLTGAMSSLKFVPPSVRFGRGRWRGRGGFSRT